MKGVGVQRYADMVVFCLVLLASTGGVCALSITPHHIVLSEYDQTQEFIVTFYNDEFAPVLVSPVIAPGSAYLSEYVVFEEEAFVLQPQGQANTKVTTRFPQSFPPQKHSLVLLAGIDRAENVTLTFRPPGEAFAGVMIAELEHRVTGGVLLVDVVFRNTGNVYLHLTPRLQLFDNQSLVKELLYPQALFVAPRQSSPLTLRQDLSGFESGEYELIVAALFRVDELVGESDTRARVFMYEREDLSIESTQDTWVIVILALGVFFGVVGMLWVGKTKKKRLWRVLEPLVSARKEVNVLRREVDLLSKQTRELVEEVQRWSTKRR